MRFFDTVNVENPVENVENLKLIHTVNLFGYVKKGNWYFAQKKKMPPFLKVLLQFFTGAFSAPRTCFDSDKKKD